MGKRLEHMGGQPLPPPRIPRPLGQPWTTPLVWWSALVARISITSLLRYGLVGMAALVGLAVGGPLAVLIYQRSLTSVEALQVARAARTAKEVEFHLAQLQVPLRYLSLVPGLVDFSARAQEDLLRGLARDSDAYEAIALVRRDGTILAAVAPFERATPAATARRLFPMALLREVIDQGAPHIGSVAYSASAQAPTLMVALPVRDRADQPAAALVARLNLNFLNFLTAQSQIGSEGYLYIVDRKATVVARSLMPEEADTYGGTSLGRIEQLDLLRAIYQPRDRALLRYRGLRGSAVLGAISPIYSMQWLVVIEKPLTKVHLPVRQAIVLVLVILGASLGLAIALGINTSRQLVRPLLALTEAAKAISEGDFRRRVAIAARNELGTLAAAFSAMGDRLQTSFNTLEQKNQDLQTTLQELEQTQLQLVQQEKMSSLGQLVAGIAHEINNPINFIHGNLSHADQYVRDLLMAVELYQAHLGDPPPALQAALADLDLDFIREDFPKVMQSMTEGSVRVRDMVTSLRNFSRLDESDHKAVDLHEGLENTLVLLRNKLKGDGDRAPIQILRDYGAAPGVECYPAQLNQVLMNLLDNAIAALEPYRTASPSKAAARTPTLAIVTQDLPPTPEICHGQATTLIEIRDNGTGMDALTRDRIFDPFFTTKPVGQGTGLGLAIAYKIITDSHRGRISCRSIPGEGTTFYIRIPRSRRDRPTLPHPTKPT
jgi:signal transduction histidine kinase